MAYNFRPSRPKVAQGTNQRLSRRDTLFQVERGIISPQVRDTKQLDDHRNRSCLQRGANAFKTASQRSDLTTGEKNIGSISPQTYNIQARIWPVVFEQDRTKRKFAPKCFDYTQNYHHYVLDLKKLEKGKEVPYLSSRTQTAIRTAVQCSKTDEPIVPSYFAGLPKRSPKSSSTSRRVSLESSSKGSFDILKVESQGITTPQTPRISEVSLTDGDPAEEFSSDSIKHELQDQETSPSPQSLRLSDLSSKRNKNSLQDLIISEIEDKLDESQLHITNSGEHELRAPLVTPEDSRVNSAVHSVPFPVKNFPKSFSRDNKPFRRVDPQIHKPYLGAFMTRIPPLKATEGVSSDERRKRRPVNDDHLPDYQRYRILCDAFRPCTPRVDTASKRKSRRYKSNSIPTEVLDYCIGIVHSV